MVDLEKTMPLELAWFLFLPRGPHRVSEDLGEAGESGASNSGLHQVTVAKPETLGMTSAGRQGHVLNWTRGSMKESGGT